MLPGDSLSQALGINDKGQIVGISCTAGFASCRAFLYEHGVMMDLNELVPDDYADHLFTANDINNDGQITGQAVQAGTEELVAVWLVPDEKRGHGNCGSGKERRVSRCVARARRVTACCYGLSRPKRSWASRDRFTQSSDNSHSRRDRNSRRRWLLLK